MAGPPPPSGLGADSAGPRDSVSDREPRAGRACAVEQPSAGFGAVRKDGGVSSVWASAPAGHASPGTSPRPPGAQVYRPQIRPPRPLLGTRLPATQTAAWGHCPRRPAFQCGGDRSGRLLRPVRLFLQLGTCIWVDSRMCGLGAITQHDSVLLLRWFQGGPPGWDTRASSLCPGAPGPPPVLPAPV